MPRALIMGAAGQDGSYLAELLLEKNYEVHGVVRSTTDLSRLQAVTGNPALVNRRFFLHHGDLADAPTIRRIVSETVPDELYHLACQSHVGLSFEQIESTCESIAIGTVRLLELARSLPKPPRFFHASSSEIFGTPDATPQDEATPFRPITPYGCAKAFSTQMVSVYRQNFGLFAGSGILYNHESPRRGVNFVTQKICRAAAAIKQGRQQELRLGNTASQRDWGDARDYVRGMWLMLQQDKPADFIFATGQLHSVQDIIEIAFAAVELDWRDYLKHDQRFMRPDDPTRLVGHPAKAKRLLNWEPVTPFKQLITEMTQAALRG
jgi:GDPmannose 4,6-dehydratase